jgi:hypothetical protein
MVEGYVNGRKEALDWVGRYLREKMPEESA